jgi:hypothetical protein
MPSASAPVSSREKAIRRRCRNDVMIEVGADRLG